MRRGSAIEARPVALVLGCGSTGSAIAVALHRAGFSVVLLDDVDPPWARRGMSFVDAWYVGSATLEGENAIFCANLRSIPAVLDRSKGIAATTWSWRGVAAALQPLALVDARARQGVAPGSLIADAPEGLFVIGVGPGFVAGEHVHAAVESEPGAELGRVLHQGGTALRRVAPPDLGGVGRERFVHAAVDGRFFTLRRIGERVAEGADVGLLGGQVVRAPLGGVLRGLSPRGARVFATCTIVEVDPRGDPARCFGIEERPRRIAQGVLGAIGAIAHNARPWGG